MKKFEYKDLDVTLYYEKMSNGLEVYVIPDHNVKSNYAFFSTKYGNRINEFIPINEKEFKRYPAGIAHFLEHKVFEQKDGVEPFKFYSAHGAYCNAFTNQNMTSYYFEGMDYFKENLEFLLDFVQNIYLTSDNVEKEKGIIIEEAKMGLDNLNRLMYEKSNDLVYVNDPRKYKVIGEIDEIKSITKEQLLECYNTFYHPSNMNLIVSGNVDYKEVFEIVRNNQNKKNYENISFPKVKQVEEPSTMNKKEIITKGNTKIPYLGHVIKIDLRNLSYDNFYKHMTIKAILYMLFSASTGFSSKLREKEIITGGVSYLCYFSNEFVIINIKTKTNKIEEFFNLSYGDTGFWKNICEDIACKDFSEESLYDLLSYCEYCKADGLSVRGYFSNLFDGHYDMEKLCDSTGRFSESYKTTIQEAFTHSMKRKKDTLAYNTSKPKNS